MKGTELTNIFSCMVDIGNFNELLQCSGLKTEWEETANKLLVESRDGM
jgi:hypothetical protein